jgi:hypothetical protein
MAEPNSQLLESNTAPAFVAGSGGDRIDRRGIGTPLF